MKTFSIRQSARVHAKNMMMCNFYMFSIFVLLVFDTIPTVGSLFDCIVGLPEKHAHGVISMFQVAPVTRMDIYCTTFHWLLSQIQFLEGWCNILG